MRVESDPKKVIPVHKRRVSFESLAYRKKIHIRLDDDLHRKLRMQVANEGTTIQNYLTDLLRKALG